MSQKLKAISVLAAALVLLSGCGNGKSSAISEDLAYEYVLRLEDYVAKTGEEYILYDFLDNMDYWYILERMDRNLLLEFMEDYLTDAYSDGWNDCEEEIMDLRDDYFWDGYYEGKIDGYAFGYAHGCGDVPYDKDMIREPDNGYIPQE